MFHKFLFLCLIILFGHLSFSQSNRNPRITFFTSVTFENSHYLSNAIENSEFEMNTGVLFGGEIVITNVNKENKFGVGIIYQHKNKFIGMDGSYSFWPIYFFNRYDFIESKDFSLGLYLSLGYNIFNASEGYITKEGSTEGNIYYSIGVINSLYKSFQLRLHYSTNNGKVNMPGTSFLVKNNFISFGIGYSF